MQGNGRGNRRAFEINKNGTTWFETQIPYELEGNLDVAYNRALETSAADWVLLLDHDLFLALNPYWYLMCLKTIQNVDDNVGMITCTTNGNEGRPQEPIVKVSKCTDLEVHVRLAHEAYEKGGYELREVRAANTLIAGYFMLVRKTAWEDIGKFKNQGKGVNKIDHDFCTRMIDADWRIVVMTGLYVYHKKYVRRLEWDVKKY